MNDDIQFLDDSFVLFVNNALANSISSDMGCEKIFKCMCVIS